MSLPLAAVVDEPHLKQATLCILVEGDPPARLLLGRKKAGFGVGKIGGFGGKVEPGESIPLAAQREMQEESGVAVRLADLSYTACLKFFFPHRPSWSQEVHVFLARAWQGEPMESVEMQPAWYTVAAIPFTQMWADTSVWLLRVLAGEHFTARFYFAADNETVTSFEIIADLKPIL